MKKKIFIISFIIFIIDQIVKNVVISNINYNNIISIIPNLFYLTYVKNTGGAFSILTGNVIPLLIIGIISIICFIYYVYKKDNFNLIEVIYLSLMIGGIFGNLVDRIIYNGVIDYIGIIIFDYYFPIFNIADISIVSSALLLIIDSLRRK